MPSPTPVSHLDQVTDGVSLWHAYDPKAKAELFSTALISGQKTWLVDPIPLASTPLARLANMAPIGGIILTNANHLRAAPEFAEQLGAPIWAHRESQPVEIPFQLLEERTPLAGLEVISINGGAPGEIALLSPAGGGTLVLGDALINFEPYGFAFLPRKYCTDEKQMRRSLHKLLAKKFDRILFAHGTPILKNARARLETLFRESA